MSLRATLEKYPMVGWGLAALLLIGAAFLLVRSRGVEQQELAETITIRCSETGKEWKMTRGAVEKQLMMRPYPINPDEGLTNPDTGKPTGFPVDHWKEMVHILNEDRKAAMEDAASSAAPKKP
ncbi:MAG TPA: hypothetical protein PL072_05170 [Phycisphaerales bacterium]|nr:hypothetical protein [Phycisphaerales bacterium]